MHGSSVNFEITKMLVRSPFWDGVYDMDGTYRGNGWINRTNHSRLDQTRIFCIEPIPISILFLQGPTLAVIRTIKCNIFTVAAIPNYFNQDELDVALIKIKISKKIFCLILYINYNVYVIYFFDYNKK